MLELSGVRYQPATAARPVLENVTFQLAPGQLALVAGRSGSGKTTLLEVISGLAEPERGRISWSGQRLSARQRRWLCGLVFQFPERHFLGLTVGQELKLGQRRLGSENAERVLRQVGLQGLSPQQAPCREAGATAEGPGELLRLVVATRAATGRRRRRPRELRRADRRMAQHRRREPVDEPVHDRPVPPVLQPGDEAPGGRVVAERGRRRVDTGQTPRRGGHVDEEGHAPLARRGPRLITDRAAGREPHAPDVTERLRRRGRAGCGRCRPR